MDKEEYEAKIHHARIEIERLDRVLQSVSFDLRDQRFRFAYATVELCIRHLHACERMIGELAGLKETVVL